MTWRALFIWPYAASPVVLTLRDSYNQTVSSGAAASAALIASYPGGVTLSAGSRAVMANGTAAIYLNVIAAEVGRCRLTLSNPR